MSQDLRPKDLPDFKNPPLNEVMVGVQFNPAIGYSQIRAGEVWELFKSEFPLTKEQPPLPPMFETFGVPFQQPFNFNMVTGAQHDRFWFVSKDQHELLQFQEDRLLHNWRKLPGGKREYPRFEKIIESFEAELTKLERYFQTLDPQILTYNQAEITYINHIVMPREGVGSHHSDWLNTFAFGEVDADDVNCTWRRVLYDQNAPFARLTLEAKTAVDIEQRKVLALTLTVRGSPIGNGIAEIVDFIKLGREVIVHEFASITTTRAHEAWNRIA